MADEENPAPPGEGDPQNDESVSPNENAGGPESNENEAGPDGGGVAEGEEGPENADSGEAVEGGEDGVVAIGEGDIAGGGDENAQENEESGGQQQPADAADNGPRLGDAVDGDQTQEGSDPDGNKVLDDIGGNKDNSGEGDQSFGPPEGGEGGGGDMPAVEPSEPVKPQEEAAAADSSPPPAGEDILNDDENDQLALNDDAAVQSPDMEEEEEFMEEIIDPTIELEERLSQLTVEIDGLNADNLALQKRVVQFKSQTKEKYQQQDLDSNTQYRITETKYLNVLNHVHQIRVRLRQQQIRAARITDELKSQLEDKRARAMECRDSFRDFKRQVAKNAEYSRTGKKIAPKIINEIEAFELEKEAEVEEVRGSNISLKNRLAKLESTLRKKDELAENLHVIDFEQLKIENQTLNEKIEERNEELHKLRKKTITTVQIITHMREKLQFIQQENNVLRSELGVLEQELVQKRDLVAQIKRERDEHKTENTRFRQQAGIVSNDNLAKDYESRGKRMTHLRADIDRLASEIRTKSNYAKSVFQLAADRGM